MIDYYEALHTSIGFGNYILSEMEDRIDRIWIEGHLTDDQRNELRTLAAESSQEDREFLNQVKDIVSDLQNRVYELEHPTDIYPIWKAGYITKKHEIVRYDVTGDGELDLCRYDGGRSETSLGIGKINGWHMLNRELENTHDITRDENGNFVVTPIEEPEADVNS